MNICRRFCTPAWISRGSCSMTPSAVFPDQHAGQQATLGRTITGQACFVGAARCSTSLVSWLCRKMGRILTSSRDQAKVGERGDKIISGSRFLSGRVSASKESTSDTASFTGRCTSELRAPCSAKNFNHVVIDSINKLRQKLLQPLSLVSDYSGVGKTRPIAFDLR